MNIKRKSGNGDDFDKVFFNNDDLVVMPDEVLDKRVVDVEYFIKREVENSLLAIAEENKDKLTKLLHFDHITLQ